MTGEKIILLAVGKNWQYFSMGYKYNNILKNKHYGKR
jgi:hypothetical protein